MYVLIITRGYPTKKSPLNGIFEFDQAKALYNLGLKVIIASIDLRSIRRWRQWGVSYISKDGIKIYNVSIPLGRIPWWILYYSGKISLLYLYKKISEINGRPDIVHAHYTMQGAIGSILKKKYNLPFIITEHSSSINKNIISRRFKSIGSFAYKNADKVISVSKALSKRIKQHFNVSSTIVHNIVDTSSFIYRKKLCNNKFRFVSVGDLIYAKGHTLLIEAFYKANFSKNVCLNIIGEGPLQIRLQKMIDKLGLKKQIILSGLMSRGEIGKIMLKSDVFVLASKTETFGLVYAEAMLAGLPVIATFCGGPEEFVNGDNGILVPVDDVDLLSKALIDMFINTTRYNGEQISQQCRKDFSSDVIGKRLLQIYTELIYCQ